MLKQHCLFHHEKKLCVVESLAKQVELNVESSPVSTHNCGGLSSKTKELILTFYNKNDKTWHVRTGSL